MPHQVTMPVLGLTMEEGTITEWLKQPGDTVAKEEPLLMVETDKSAVEVVSPATGTLSQIVAQAGQTVPVRELIGVIALPGEAVEEAVSAAPAAPSAPAGPVPAPAAPAPPPSRPFPPSPPSSGQAGQAAPARCSRYASAASTAPSGTVKP
jgi:pyruvate/2-oxoglutarate dehydrogenase complex dihydrolipoamide acyltransferase (E2) component